MGYPMAINLRKKMDPSHKLLICDVSKDALTKFQSEMSGSGPIEVVANGAEAVAQAVRLLPSIALPRSSSSLPLPSLSEPPLTKPGHSPNHAPRLPSRRSRLPRLHNRHHPLSPNPPLLQPLRPPQDNRRMRHHRNLHDPKSRASR